MTLKEVYDEHFRFVWRALRRLGVPDSDVSDVAQEVFLVVHRKLAEFEGRSKMTTWLFAICMNIARDWRRAGARREVPDGDKAADAKRDSSSDLAAEVERRQRLVLLEDILDQLGEEQRTVFALFELEGLSGLEIAELLDIPVGTVHSRLRLAREAFRKVTTRLQARGQIERAEGGAP